MLNNSKLVDGQQGKELTKAIKDYTDASAVISDAEKTKKASAKVIKEVCTEVGTYETLDAVVTMNLRQGGMKFNEELFKTEHPDLYEKYLYKTSDIVTIGKMQVKNNI